jgi:hypothetical protein
MSLKAFHLLFITAASALALGCAVWWLKEYWSDRSQVEKLLGAFASLAVLAGLVLYERYFLRKLRKVSLL